eukprot:TRINITY_DN6081_c0_g1_i2.p1 TRINITY_DN6081_c0_g1~~TRINITY_DN6081_c0_g1_i2.p1  ORF type:complete len:926 (-),score=278.93 TRINITY_DN6081_c0_g1_i2:15-2792(-)
MGRSKPKQAPQKGKAQKTDTTNPFEIRKQHVKKQVLNSRTRGTTQQVGKSRALAQSKRDQTLGIEHQRRNNTNRFVDRRFDGVDDSLSPEEKNLILFQREKTKQWDKESFLDGEDNHMLTHLGADLEFNLIDEGADDDEPFFDEDAPFGGMRKVDQEGRKSKEEVMKEVIAKSKMYRDQDRVEKEENENLTEQLDTNFHLIRGLLSSRNKGKDVIKPGDKDAILRQLAQKRAEEEEEDDFDKLSKEFATAPRAAPSDPLETDEARAFAERSRLEQLEEARIRRMNGEEDDIGGLEEEYEALGVEGIKAAPYKKKGKTYLYQDSKKPDWSSRGGDDMDDFDLDLSEDSKSSSSDSDSDSDSEDSGEDTKEKRRAARIAPEDVIHPTKPPAELPELTSLGVTDDIPFTISLPSSYQNFVSLIDPQSPSRQAIIIKRIRACTHVSLSEKNKEKMKTFYGYLIKYISHFGKKESHNVDTLNLMCKIVFQLSSEMPGVAAGAAKHYLGKINESYSARGQAPSASHLLLFSLLVQIWPVSDQRHVVVTPALVLMSRMLVNTELKHLYEVGRLLHLANTFLNCITPGQRFASEPFIFLVSVLTAFTEANPNLSKAQPAPVAEKQEAEGAKNSKKRQRDTEATQNAKSNYQALPLLLTNVNTDMFRFRNMEKVTSTATPSALSLTLLNNLEATTKQNAEAEKANKKSPKKETKAVIEARTAQEDHEDQIRLSILSATLQSLEKYFQIYIKTTGEGEEVKKESQSSLNLVDGIIPQLVMAATAANQLLHRFSLPPPVIGRIKALITLSNKTQKEREGKLKPLQLNIKTKLVISNLLTPDFDDHYSGQRRDKTVEYKQREQQKLKYLLKQEQKGAAKDLRQDAQYLARKRADQRKELDEERKQKTNALMHILETQQHEGKVVDASKKNKRRRTAF